MNRGKLVTDEIQALVGYNDIIQKKGGVVMPNMPKMAKCPKCASEDVETRWTLMTLVSWIFMGLGSDGVRIYDKKCERCGNEFQVFRNPGASMSQFEEGRI
jgi:hypothetical protein